MPLEPGATLDSYEIIAPLGSGGMGVVYRAKDVRLGREVALKIINASCLGEAEHLRRFEQEARSAGQLNNPHIVTIYDVGSHDGCPYIVSELLEGETLREHLKGRSLPARKAVAYALQIAKGLAAAHDRGIIHRDLKPENVLVTKDGCVKLLDFGLAKLVEGAGGDCGQTHLSTVSINTTPGTLLGTVGYMSPEQVRALPTDHRSDLFSFGALLYEMLWGERAFRRESNVETLNAILHDTPCGLLEVDGRVPLGLECIVSRCLEKNPDERFQSTRDLFFSLEALSKLSGPVAPPQPKPRMRARLRVWLALLTLLCALGAGAFLLGGVARRPTLPSFRQLTFRRGLIDDARFSPDGQTVYYSAAWDGNQSGLFFTRPSSPESSQVQLPESAKLLSVSSVGQMALLLSRGGAYGGVLALAPLAGGQPRETYDNVQWADWSPDGEQLAAVRGIGRMTQLEYPLKTPLFKTGGSIICPRVSPDGQMVAFIHEPLYGDNSGSVIVVDRDRRVVVRSATWPDVIGLAWSPGGGRSGSPPPRGALTARSTR